MPAFFRIPLCLILIWKLALFSANAQDKTTILLFGDSIIAGYGVAAEESVPSQLQKIYDEKHRIIEVINGGVSGETTGQGRERLATTLDKYNPDVVVVALGTNDVLRGLPVQATKENLAAMLALLQKRKIRTILSGVLAPGNAERLYGKEFNAIYATLAKQYGVPLIPFLIGEDFNENGLMQPDNIHPNAKGTARIAENIAGYVK